MANDAARHISPEGLATLEVELRELETTRSWNRSDWSPRWRRCRFRQERQRWGTHPRYRNGRRAVVCVGAKLAAAFRQERVCPPSQYARANFW